MINFQPDQATFGDLAGYGMFDIGHYREHVQFAQLFPVVLYNYDFSSFLTAGPSRKSQLETHAQAHSVLEELAGITGIDWTAVDFDKQEDFYSWMGYHASTHAQLRRYLGIT